MTGAAGHASKPGFRGRAKAAEPPVFRPGAPEAVAAIESLYVDEVRPQGRILLKRLAELAAAKAAGAYAKVNRPGLADDLPRIDANRLRKVCDRCRQVTVQEEESGEYCALLAGRSGSFVDACANTDDYPAQMWRAAAGHFSSRACKDMVLPGGRYACAQSLKAQELPFLAGYSLGRICHIVQLAISRRHILGYLSGQVVPYGRSEAVVKERCAKQMEQAVLGPRAVPALPLATIDQVRDGLLELLADAPGQPPMSVPLPNVKRLFRSRFNLDLSETALGQSRLCELLQDARFGDVCEVHLQGNGYVVTRSSSQEEEAPPPASPEPWPAHGQPLQAAAEPAPASAEAWTAYCEQAYCERAVAPGSPEAWPSCEYLAYGPPQQLAEVGPMQVMQAPMSGEAWTTYYEQGASAAPCSPEAWPSCGCVAYGPPPAAEPAPGSPEAWPQAYAPQSSRTRLPSEASGWEERRCASPSVASQDDSSTVAPSTPMPEWPAEWAVGDSCDWEPGCAETSPPSPAPFSEAGLLLCEELPLGQDAELAEDYSGPSILRGGRWFALMSPSVLAEDGCIGSTVKNTFIHFSPSAGSAGGARRRARSLPRAVGSSRSDWEAACHGMLFLNERLPSAPAADSPEFELAGEAAPQRRCWGPAAPEDADRSTTEAPRLWGCDPIVVEPEEKASPAWRPTLRHRQPDSQAHVPSRGGRR